MSEHPYPWRCASCGAVDNFMATSDRLLHVRRGHLSPVVDAAGNVVRWKVGSAP